MKTRIVQVQGTSGAGKTTLARALMKWASDRKWAVVALVSPDEKILGYELQQPKTGGRRVFLVGKYTTPCGGCDQVGSSKEVLRRVREWAERGDVVFEGLLLSGGQGSLGRAMLKYGDRFAYAFLDTPLKVCLQRVQGRRNARAKLKGKKAEPLNPKNTTTKWHACQRYRERVLSMGYKRLAVLPHKDPLPGLLKLLNLGGRK